MTSGLYLPEDSPDVVNAKQDFDPIGRVLDPIRARRWLEAERE